MPNWSTEHLLGFEFVTFFFQAIEGNVICGTEKGYVCVFDTTGRLWHQQRLSRSKIVDINVRGVTVGPQD